MGDKLVRSYLTWSVFPEGDTWVGQVIVSLTGDTYSKAFATKEEADTAVAVLRATLLAAHNAKVGTN
jgi:hypothetical protein